jgi:hypothetical protein
MSGPMTSIEEKLIGRISAQLTRAVEEAHQAYEFAPGSYPRRQTNGSASRPSKRPKHWPGLLAERPRKKQKTSGGKRQILVAETHTENANSKVRKPPLLGSVRIPPLLLYLGEGMHRRPTGADLP